MNYKLILFDIDGTIADRDSVEIYPVVKRFIESLDPSVSVAFITNQGGPPCRNTGWEFSSTFPTRLKVQARLDNLMKVIYDLLGRKPSLYVAWVYQDKYGQVYDLSGPVKEDTKIKKCLFWRKPGPGMILQACLDSSTRPAETLMIGDNFKVDGGAADAAGVAFEWAWDYIGSPIKLTALGDAECTPGHPDSK